MMETHEERAQRYRDSEQCEMSGRDFCATVQYGPAGDGEEEDDEDDAMDVSKDGLMEF